MAESVERKVQAMMMTAQPDGQTQASAAGAAVKVRASQAKPAEDAPGPAIESEAIQLDDGKMLTIRDIHQNWRRIHAMIKKYDARTAGLINSCKPVALKDGKLVLGFQSDIVKSKMEDGKNIELTRRVIVHLLSAQVDIECLVMNEKVDLSKFDPSQAGDGMVSEALNLGGQVKKTEKFQ